MRDRALFYVVVGVAVLAAFIDSAGRLLSFVFDGLLMAVLVSAVFLMLRGHRDEIARLRGEIARLRMGGGHV